MRFIKDKLTNGDKIGFIISCFIHFGIGIIIGFLTSYMYFKGV